MRVALIAAISVATVVAAITVGAPPAKSREAPWCAFISVGTGAMYEDCQYATFEECRPRVLAGNRGFCNPNPRWTGPVVVTRARHKRQVRHD